jgi:DNA-binding MarR family transcriptional regulator
VDRSRNPYRTAPGSDPPELAGRAGELGAGSLAIAMSAAREPAKPIVFTGLRGMGKTALLRRVARDAQAAGAITIVGEADRSLRFGEVMRRELLDARTNSASLPTRLSSAIGKLIENLPKISYEMPHESGSFTLSGQDRSEASDRPSSDSLEDVLQDLNGQLHAHGRFLMIGLDEIQESSAGDLLRIIRVVHKTAGTDRPILFIGAGLPNSSTVLRAVRTYTERWAFYRLELLSRGETAEAVDVPARLLQTRWEQEAVEELYLRTRGYPYFLQEYASAAWLHHQGKIVNKSDIEAVAPGVQRMLDQSVYDRQFDQLTPRELGVALALHELGPGAHRPEEIAEALGVSSSAALSSARAQLIKKDIIYVPARGLAEFRMPLTNEYIERHKSGFVKRAKLAGS